MSSPTPPLSVLSWREKLAYAAGDTASCFYWQTFSLFLMIFYTDTFGLEAKDVAMLFLVSRIWDAITDPIMGVIADRTRSRHGFFRPWILWGIIPFVVSGILLFVTPDFGPTGKLIYAYATYSLVMLAYTIVNVPYGALLGVISPYSNDRTQLASYRFVGAFFGNVVVQSLLLVLVARLGGGNDRLGYPLAFACFAAGSAALFYFTFRGTRERVVPERSSASVGTDLRDLFRNRPWVMLCLLGLGSLIYISIRGGATLYYFKYFRQDQGGASSFLVAGTLSAIVGSLLTPTFTRWCGSKRTTLIALTLASAAAMLAFYFVTPQDQATLYLWHIALSIPGAALMPLIWSMYADTADYGEWKFGRRATGLIFSAATFSQKMGWAVGGALAAYILDWVGFVANVDQSAQALSGIRHMMSTIPAAIAVGVAVLAFAYPLSRQQEQSLASDLVKRKSGHGPT